MTLRQLARADLAELLAALAAWHPDLTVGEEQQLLRLSPVPTSAVSERYEVAPGVVRCGFEAAYGVGLAPRPLSLWPDEAARPPARAAVLRAFR